MKYLLLKRPVPQPVFSHVKGFFLFYGKCTSLMDNKEKLWYD